LGTGGPVANKPPAAVMSRPVVALRTPAPMPRSFNERQAQAGGHLNQQSSIQQSLVRQEAPGRPVPVARQPQSADGFRPSGEATTGSSPAKPQPRVWEAQGTPEPEKSTQAQPENRAVQAPASHSAQQGAQQPARQWSHPLAKPVAPVQEKTEQQQKEQEQKFSTWQQQKPASTAPRQQNSHPAAPPPSAPPKGH
jgi:hypothetical protein